MSSPTGAGSVAVIALGGGAGNALNRMLAAGLPGVTAIAANTDAQDLRRSRAETKVLLGREITRGLGANADPEIGAEAALATDVELRAALAGARLVILLVSLGGGTGSGAAPVVVRLAREAGAFAIPIVAQPFAFEGRRRRRQAEEAVAQVAESNDGTVATAHAGVLLDLAGSGMIEAFREMDDAMDCAVRSLLAVVADVDEHDALDDAVATWAASWTPRVAVGTGSEHK